MIASPPPPTLKSFDPFPVLDGRAKDLPSDRWAYKLVDTGAYGLDVAIEQPSIDEAKMSAWIPYADGNRRDGVGDRLNVGGINTERHRKNPVILFDHGKQVVLPIAMGCERGPDGKYDLARYKNVIDPATQTARINAAFYQGKGLTGVDRTQEYDHAVLSEQYFDMLCKGLLRSGSIGYQIVQSQGLPPNYETGTPQGLHLIAVLMLEASLVVMPANADTVRKALCLGTCCGKPLSPMLVKSLQPYAPASTKTQVGYQKSTIPPARFKPGVGAMKSLRQKYRKGHRHVVRKGADAASTFLVGEKDIDAVRSAAQARGLKFSLLHVKNGHGRVKLSGADGAIGEVARLHGRKSMDVQAKSNGSDHLRGENQAGQLRAIHAKQDDEGKGKPKKDEGKKPASKPEPKKERTETSVVAEKREIEQEIGHLGRMSGAQGFVGINPADKTRWDELHNKRDALARELHELARPAREAAEKAEQVRKDAAWDKEKTRIANLPVKQKVNGWELCTDGANWFVRDPHTKEEVYKGRQSRARAVAKESPPDSPGKSLSALRAKYKTMTPSSIKSASLTGSLKPGDIVIYQGQDARVIAVHGNTCDLTIIDDIGKASGRAIRHDIIPGVAMAALVRKGDKSMNTATKDLPTDEVETAGDEAATQDTTDAAGGADPAEDGAADEKFGSQVLRVLHEDFLILMQKYDELVGPLENDEISKELQGFLEEIEGKLSTWEDMHAKHYGDHGYPALGEGSKDMDGDSDSGSDNAAPADSEQPPEEPAEDAVAGMKKEGKALHASGKYGKGLCGKCGAKSAPDRGLGVEGRHKPGDEEDKQRRRDGKSIPAQDQGTVSTDDLGIEGSHKPGFEEETQQAKSKSLKPHHVAACGAASGFLKALNTTTEFADAHRLEAFHHGATLCGHAADLATQDTAAGVQHPDSNLPPGGMKSVGSSDNRTGNQLGVESGHVPGNEEAHIDDHVKCMHGAGTFLKSLGTERAFGDMHREKALVWHKALQPIAEMTAQDDAAGVHEPASNPQDVPPGEMGTKALLEENRRTAAELSRVQATINGLLAKV